MCLSQELKQSLNSRQSSLQDVNPRTVWRDFHCLQRKSSDDHDSNLGILIKCLNSNWMKPGWILLSSTAFSSKRHFYCNHEVILQVQESSKWPPEPTHGRVWMIHDHSDTSHFSKYVIWIKIHALHLQDILISCKKKKKRIQSIPPGVH